MERPGNEYPLRAQIILFWWRASFDASPLGQDELTPNEESWLREIGDQLRANADNWGEFTLTDFAYPPFTLNGRRNAGNAGVRR